VEGEVTWSNRPAASADVLSTVSVHGTVPEWYEVDVTEYVQARRSAGATAATLVLKGVSDSLPYASFASREAMNGPRLIVTGGT
jgi:hypothetical protein